MRELVFEMDKIVCYNRDRNGECMAYNEMDCHSDCPARISDIGNKIRLLECLLKMSQSKKDQRRLSLELEDAKKVQEAIRSGKFEGWMSCYMEDVHRGEKGGASEGDASNRKTGMKQLMKDNRAYDVKPSKDQQEAYKEALAAWEEENGKLDRLGRTSMSGSRLDSYTGIPICFCNSGLGHCRGQRSAAGTLARDCRECEYLEK